MVMKITAEQVGVDNLGDLNLRPRWPERGIGVGAPENLDHTAAVHTIYSALPGEIVLNGEMRLRDMGDFRTRLAELSMPYLSPEEYLASLVESNVIMRITPRLKTRLFRAVEMNLVRIPTGYRSSRLSNPADHGTGTEWQYSPPPVDDERLDKIRYYLRTHLFS